MRETEVYAPEHRDGIMLIASEILSSYVGNNSVPKGELPDLIASVFAAVAGCVDGATAKSSESEITKLSPAEISASIRPDGILSFIDGRTYKTLRRHLNVHGLTAESCRARYGLAPDYPMVSANYSAQRSELAKAIGLGTIGNRAPEPLAA